MPERDFDQLGSLQAAVMEILWDRGESTVRDVQEALPGDPAPAYTTVLTILQKLTKSKWTTHRKDGRTYVYRPLCSREEAGRSAIRRFVTKVFDGDRMMAMQQLIGDTPLGDEEIARLRSLIETAKNARGTEGATS